MPTKTIPAGRRTARPIAYTTDVDGEQQIAIRPADGGAEKILTHFAERLLLQADVVARRQAPGLLRRQSPAMARRRRQRRAEPGGAGQATTKSTIRLFARRPLAGLQPDRRQPAAPHLALRYSPPARRRGVIATDDNDSNPIFSPDGKYLYFVSTPAREPDAQRDRVQFRDAENDRHLCRDADRRSAAFAHSRRAPDEARPVGRARTVTTTSRGRTRGSPRRHRRADQDRPRRA